MDRRKGKDLVLRHAHHFNPVIRFLAYWTGDSNRGVASFSDKFDKEAAQAGNIADRVEFSGGLISPEATGNRYHTNPKR